MSIQDLIDNRIYGALFILARYLYRNGEPIITDAQYDTIEKYFRENCYDRYKEYLDRTYDDDPVPYELLKEIGVKPIQTVSSGIGSEYYSYLNEDKSLSIKSAHDYETAFEFFRMLRSAKQDFVASLKMDGVNTKMLYVDGEFKISLSRGRNAGNSFDYTENSAKVMPFHFDTGAKTQKVVGESYVLEEALPYLREKYKKPNGYVTSKSAAISMLRVAHDREDYKWLKTRVFSVEGFTDTHAELFEKLQQVGIDVPPYKKFSWKEIPADFDSFKVWVKKEILDVIWEQGKGIPSDGVVIEVNDYSWLGEEKNQYVSRQLALKFEYWGNKYYKGVVKDIKVKQQRVFQSIRVEIETVRTHDGAKAEFINCFNPDILFQSNAQIGNTVYFERNSNAINVLLYGDKLKAVLEGEIDG
jgi:NAD-dependent DNA ligase